MLFLRRAHPPYGAQHRQVRFGNVSYIMCCDSTHQRLRIQQQAEGNKALFGGDMYKVRDDIKTIELVHRLKELASTRSEIR